MLKYIILLLFVPFMSNGQNVSIAKMYKFPNGFILNSGDHIIIGKPSRNNSYVYIHGNKNFTIYENDTFVIKHIVKTENSTGINIRLKGYIRNKKHTMTFVEAVYKNEVIIPEKYRRGLLPEDVDVTELIKLVDGDIFYELVFDLHNTDKEKIFNAAKLAIIKMYVDAKEVIQDENRESGILICKGISTDVVEVDHTSYNATYYNVVEITIKDNKCRVRIINPNVSLIYYTYSYAAGMALPNTHNIPKAPVGRSLPTTSFPVASLLTCASKYPPFHSPDFYQLYKKQHI